MRIHTDENQLASPDEAPDRKALEANFESHLKKYMQNRAAERSLSTDGAYANSLANNTLDYDNAWKAHYFDKGNQAWADLVEAYRALSQIGYPPAELVRMVCHHFEKVQVIGAQSDAEPGYIIAELQEAVSGNKPDIESVRGDIKAIVHPQQDKLAA